MIKDQLITVIRNILSFVDDKLSKAGSGPAPKKIKKPTFIKDMSPGEYGYRAISEVDIVLKDYEGEKGYRRQLGKLYMMDVAYSEDYGNLTKITKVDESTAHIKSEGLHLDHEITIST